ncbi:MAG: DUF2442 domain-containing protein [Deltaproteobacteria bacterium]|jgi:hypothetical protein|nr:DUF2442 domain-containing protein [Deltaproteobacteria bacterium]
MNISPNRVWFDADTMWVELNDARVIGAPLAWFPRLLQADESELARYELSPGGIHWEALNEDISVAGLLEGRGDMTKRPKVAA